MINMKRRQMTSTDVGVVRILATRPEEGLQKKVIIHSRPPMVMIIRVDSKTILEKKSPRNKQVRLMQLEMILHGAEVVIHHLHLLHIQARECLSQHQGGEGYRSQRQKARLMALR